MKRALLIYNPAAGGARNSKQRVSDLSRRLEVRGFSVTIEPTQAPGHARELCQQARDRVDGVFSYGGDGTLRECASGLIGSTTPLGFLPAGTANVMTRVLGLPRDPMRAADLLAGGSVLPIDIGLCGERPLLMQASAGLDAEVLARLDPTRKRRLGKLEVALQFLPAWWSFRYPSFEVHWGDQRRAVTFAAVCNIPFYGGRWKITDATWDDGYLDLVLFSGRGRRATLAFARDLLLNRHQQRSDVEMVRVAEAEICAADGLALQIDGDFFPDALPARVRLSGERVDFMVPA